MSSLITSSQHTLPQKANVINMYIKKKDSEQFLSVKYIIVKVEHSMESIEKATRIIEKNHISRFKTNI